MHSQLPKRFLWMAALLALASRPARASLDFDTYSIVKNTVEVTHDTVTYDSTWISYQLSRLGSTSLEASSITLRSHGSYVAVTEEATLTGNIEYRPHDITKEFLLQGSLPIPPLAAVRSLAAIHGDTLFPAKLHKMIYSLDDSFLDTLALRNTLNNRVAFLQQLTDRSFEATFSKISLGEPVRVRIEYDIPFSGAPGASLRIPVLFHPSGAPPRQAQITFFENAPGLPPVQWLSASGRVTMNDSGTHTVPYQSEYVFRRDESPKTSVTLQTTVFESGAWKGNYLLFKGGLDDSTMNMLSRPLEVVFLWRWTPPFNFVETQNGLKTLSALGQLAVAEAQAIRKVITQFAPRGHRFGLLRSFPGGADTLFAPAEEGSAGYRRLLEYLDRFTEQRLYADYKDYHDDRIPWSPSTWKDSGEIMKSRNEFLATLGTIRKSFGNRPEALRHIEIIGLGSGVPSSLVDLKDPRLVEEVIDSVTIANVQAEWLGVDMSQALQVKADANLRPLDIPELAALGPVYFPVFQPTSVEYRAFTPGRSEAMVMPFDAGAQLEAVVKADGPFADTLQLQGIDALGRKTRIFTLTPRMLRGSDDSGLARVWAADPDRIAENSEIDLGMRYGILTKGTYWGGGINDGMPYQGNQNSGTIMLPKAAKARVFRLEKGFLRIDAAWAAEARSLDVYDVRGKLVLSIPLASFRSGNGFAIPAEYFRRLGMLRLMLVLRGAGRMQTFSLNLGGF